MSIRDLRNPWRDAMLPASFRGALFHVEAASKESGRRIVTHEFPKKELPYSEDMGRVPIAFSVRGYCIVYPVDTSISLYRRDYRIARDLLLDELQSDQPGGGVLQLPHLPPMTVVCPRFRMTEEQRFGGYCVFDMQFVELGRPPFAPMSSSRDNLINASQELAGRILEVMAGNA